VAATGCMFNDSGVTIVGGWPAVTRLAPAPYVSDVYPRVSDVYPPTDGALIR